jgi:excisionase family DNA binding protein
MAGERMLSPDDVAKYLGISRKQVYRYIVVGALPAFQPQRRGRIFIKFEDIERWLEGGRVKILDA